MGKPTWDNTDKTIYGIKCGTKIYDITDKQQLDSCVSELAVRRYLQVLNFVNVTRLVKVEPEAVQAFVNGTYDEAAKIYNDIFENVKNNIEEIIIKNNIKQVELYIEKGQNIVDYQMHRIANHSDKNTAEKMVVEIFSLVQTMHSNLIVHADLKPHNLMYGVRNGEETLLLNDFDTSFVLSPEFPSRSIDNPALTVAFAAPEQFGIPNHNIGYATDVFSAALISYIVLNQGIHPAEYHPDDFDATIGDDSKKNVEKMFKKMLKGEISWTPSQYGNSKIKEVILKAMDINKTKRPTAQQVLDVLKEEPVAVPEPESPQKTADDSKKKEENTPSIQISIHQEGKSRGNVQIGKGNTIGEDKKSSESTNKSKTFILAAVLLIALAYLFVAFKSSSNDSANEVMHTALTNIDNIATTFTSSEVTTLPTTATTTIVTFTTADITETKAVETTMPIVTNPPVMVQNGDNVNIQGNNNTISGSFNGDNIYNDNHTENNNTNNETNIDYTEINNYNNEPIQEEPVAVTVDEPEEIPLFSYKFSPYDDSIILTGFNREFTETVLNIQSTVDGYTVGGIGEHAFAGNNSIEEIHIPDTVYAIYESAFYNLYNLKTVYFGVNVNEIWEKAFFLDDVYSPRTFYFKRPNIDLNSILYGDYCFGFDGEYIIDYFTDQE